MPLTKGRQQQPPIAPPNSMSTHADNLTAPDSQSRSETVPTGLVSRLFTLVAPSSPSQLVQRVMLTTLIVSVIALCIANPTFRSSDNLLNVLQQAAMVGVIAGGMQLMILSGGFDLSVGIVAAAAGCAAAYISLQSGLVAGVAVGLLVGLLVGFANGVLVAKIGINPFVATFGTQAVVTGVLYAATSATPIAPLPSGWTDLGLKNIAGVSFVSLTFIGVILILLFILRCTLFGQHIYAVGSNKEGSRRAGIHVDRVLIAVYTIGGICAAIAGILLVSISGIGSPSTGTQWALLAIAAVIIGGTPLSGGVGGISSAVIGILSLTILANALNLYSVSAFWQPALTGAAVLIAVSFESYRSSRKR